MVDIKSKGLLETPGRLFRCYGVKMTRPRRDATKFRCPDATCSIIIGLDINTTTDLISLAKSTLVREGTFRLFAGSSPKTIRATIRRLEHLHTFRGKEGLRVAGCGPLAGLTSAARKVSIALLQMRERL